MIRFALTSLLNARALNARASRGARSGLYAAGAGGFGLMRLVLAVCFVVALQSALHPATAQEKAAQRVEGTAPEAAATLARFQAYIRNAAELSFDVSARVNSSVGGGTTEATASFLTRKPNIFRIDVAVKGRSYVVSSDGKLVTIWRSANQTYAQYPASDSMLQTMYTIVGLTNISGRMLDFFWAANERRDVTVSSISSLEVGGRQCTGIRVVRFEETFDVWVEPKGEPLPCRLQSRRTDGAATTVHTYLFKWKAPGNTQPDAFGVTVSKGARRVDALSLR